MSDWRESALCAQTDPGLFFPEEGTGTSHAKAICAKCSVRPECRADILQWEAADKTRRPHGVFGGLSAWERRPDRYYKEHPPCHD